MSDLTYGLFVRGQYHAGDDMGNSRMILSVHWVGMPHSQVVDTLDLFTAEVMPKVAQAL